MKSKLLNKHTSVLKVLNWKSNTNQSCWNLLLCLCAFSLSYVGNVSLLTFPYICKQFVLLREVPWLERKNTIYYHVIMKYLHYFFQEWHFCDVHTADLFLIWIYKFQVQRRQERWSWVRLDIEVWGKERKSNIFTIVNVL